MTPLELCNTEEGEITPLGLCNTEEGEITPLEEQTCIENNTEYKLDTSANKEIISELMGGNLQCSKSLIFKVESSPLSTSTVDVELLILSASDDTLPIEFIFVVISELNIDL
jgi:hypothetical protein